MQRIISEPLAAATPAPAPLLSCPGCQSTIPADSQRCPICRRLLHFESAAASGVAENGPDLTPGPAALREPEYDGPCPICNHAIMLASLGQPCPVCGSDLRFFLRNAVGPSVVPSAAGGFSPTAQPRAVLTAETAPGFGEGTVRLAPEALRQEPPDVDPLQSLVALLLLLEIIVESWRISALFFVLVLAYVSFSLLIGRPAANSGWLREALALPYRLLEVFAGRALPFGQQAGLQDQRTIWQYQLELAAGAQESFTVKGRLGPQPLEQGHYVRIWAGDLNGEPRLRRVTLRDPATGAWRSLHPADVSPGLYWLLGLLILTVFLVLLDLMF